MRDLKISLKVFFTVYGWYPQQLPLQNSIYCLRVKNFEKTKLHLWFNNSCMKWSSDVSHRGCLNKAN